jgi:hypothetical protein
MTVLTLGSGFLTLHTIGNRNGMITMIVVILIGWTVNLFCNMVVSDASLTVNFKTFVEMIEMTGNRFLSIVCNYMITVGLFIANAMNFIFMTQFIMSIGGYFEVDLKSQGITEAKVIFVIYVLNFCGSLIKQVSSLRLIGILLSCVLLSIVVVLVA